MKFQNAVRRPAVGPEKFEMTMSSRRGKERLTDVIKIGDTWVEAKELCSDGGFLHAPAGLHQARKKKLRCLR